MLRFYSSINLDDKALIRHVMSRDPVDHATLHPVAGNYEQRVQEQPSCMVRSSFRHPAAHEDWAQLGVPLNGQFADQERIERLGDRNGILNARKLGFERTD